MLQYFTYWENTANYDHKMLLSLKDVEVWETCAILELMKYSKFTGQTQPLAFWFVIWGHRIWVAIIDHAVFKMDFYH